MLWNGFNPSVVCLLTIFLFILWQVTHPHTPIYQWYKYPNL
jgi:hypothetical protein